MPFQPHNSLTHEDQSRLLLWMSALEQTKRLLRLAERALAAQGSAEMNAKLQKHCESSQAFARAQPDYTPGMQKSSHFSAHDELYPREFADPIDCFETANACRMLAIVFFCQVFKGGYAEDGNVAGNKPEFIRGHLDNILCLAYPHQEARNAFSSMRMLIESARDNMLAHADAKAFEVTSFDAGMHLKLHAAALTGIDFSAFTPAVESLIPVLIQYAFGTAP